MKTATIEGVTSGENPGPTIPPRSRVGADYAELVKARLTILVLLTTAAGYYLAASPPIKFLGLLHVVLGTACAAAGAAALNQWWERKVDALMERTKDRPVPAGRMPAAEALIAGTVLAVVGIAYLAVNCNIFSAVLAAITVAIYVFAYTPLKRVTSFNTLVGTVPGALPPLIGWVAARGRIDPGAWSLFAIMVLWQLPHFFAISWMCREDYSRAGFQMISNDDVRGDRSASQSVFFTMLLLVMAGLPAFVGVVSQIYVPIELLLGGCYVAIALQFLQKRTVRSARLLFLTSVIYLPLLLGALVMTKL
jgi:protoheme IX farnesyltransferase